MDYNELLFAAEVRRLATELRHNDWLKYSRAADEAVERSQRANITDQKRAFDAETPLEPYLLRAVGLIRDAASYLRTLPKD